MNKEIVILLVVLLIIAALGISLDLYYSNSDNKETSMEIPIIGLNAGSVELLSHNGKPYVVIWDSHSDALYLISLKSTVKSVNLSNYKPIWRSKEDMGPHADMVFYGNSLYVAISTQTNTSRGSVIVRVDLGNMNVKTINVSQKYIDRIFYWDGIWIEDWYNGRYHIEKLDHGITETVYNFSQNITPVQENMFVYNGILYYSFLLGHNTPSSTYEILAISNNSVYVVWKVKGNFEYGYSTVVNNSIYSYLLEGSGGSARTVLYVMNFKGSILHKYTLSASNIVHHYGDGIFVGGTMNIAYSKDGQHFREIYYYHRPLLPLWSSQPHTTVVYGNWLYELAFKTESSSNYFVIVAVTLEK